MPLEYGPVKVHYNGQLLGTTTMTTLADNAKIRAYNEGWRAWERDTIPNKDSLCPYPISHPVVGLRQYWFEGLYDHKFMKYSHIPESTDVPSIKQTKTKNMGK